MKFTHLHVHSHYSLLDGLPKIDDLIKEAKYLKMDSVALTDHGAMYGLVEFYKKAKKESIKPILGCELYIAYEKMNQKRIGIDDKRYHLIVLVKNKTGYKNLIKLITLANLEGFYYKPRIDKDLLKKYSEGLIGMSACLQGEIPKAIIRKNLEKAENLIKEYINIFGKENFYLEIQPHFNIPEQKEVNKNLILLAKKFGLGIVASNDVHYLKKEDAQAQDILMAVQTGHKLNEEDRLTLKNDDFSFKSSEEMIEIFKDIPEAIENTQKIANLCNFDFEIGNINLPEFTPPQNKMPDEYLKELCYLGMEKKYPNINGLQKEKLNKQLEYELSVIKKMNFSSYFLIVADFVNWAKNNGIVVGPGRGSAAGSLVSYLLNITNIDPIKYNLLFERFLNPERISMPDIDLDFADTRRDEVVEYVSKKYGQNHVAQIITFGTMAARAAIRDTGRALNYSYKFCDTIAKMIPPNMSLNEALNKIKELNQLYTNDPETKRLIDSAKKLEGVARHASVHACGVVISKQPLDELVPIQNAPTSTNAETKKSKTLITQYEMRSIEDLGLLKIDFLGLKNLTIIEKTIKLIKKLRNISIDIDKIPLDNEKTFKLFQNSETVGVFQLESSGVRRYLKELKPTELEDIIALISLYRPGPIEFIPNFIDRKFGRKKIEYLHPKLEPILKNTYGIIVYQEQIIEIAKQLAGFSAAEADTLRKAIGKKIKKLLLEQKNKFIEGCIKNNIDANLAKLIFDFIEPFARYGFNRSHAVCYALIAYHTAFLKANYPVEFITSIMNTEQNDIERIAELITECKNMNIEILPPDVNQSFENFTVILDENGKPTNKIRFGLTAIKNVGSKIVEAIIKERKKNGKFQSIDEFLERVQHKDLNKKTLESLIKSGALDEFGERNQLLFNIDRLLDYNREHQRNQKNNQISLFSGATKIQSLKLKEIESASKSEKLQWEKELLGFYISEHPLNDYQEIFKRLMPIKNISEESKNKIVIIGGIISTIKKITTKRGEPMLFVNLEDLTNKIEIIVFPSMFSKKPEIWQENKIIAIKGKVDNRNGNLKIICDDAKEIHPQS